MTKALDVVGGDLVVEADGACHVPAVDHEVEAEEAVDRLLIRAASEVAVERLRAFRRIAGSLGARLTAFAASADPGVVDQRLGRPEAMTGAAVRQAAGAWQCLTGELVQRSQIEPRVPAELRWGTIVADLLFAELPDLCLPTTHRCEQLFMAAVV